MKLNSSYQSINQQINNSSLLAANSTAVNTTGVGANSYPAGITTLYNNFTSINQTLENVSEY